MKSPFACFMLPSPGHFPCPRPRRGAWFRRGHETRKQIQLPIMSLAGQAGRGPSFRAIAKRYASDPNAQGELDRPQREHRRLGAHVELRFPPECQGRGRLRLSRAV